jgi:lipooligosaccharide transport system permease protein
VSVLTFAAERQLRPTITPARGSARVIERNARAYRRGWLILASGFFEPVLYLLAIGLGVGALVGDLPGPGGEPIAYEQFVAPAMLVSAAMTGAVADTTFNFFVKLKYGRTYDAMLATPLSARDVALGEVGWALIRGALYAAAFLIVMAAFGLTPSWWAILTVPVALLVGFAFAGVGLAATTFMRSFVDFDFVQLAIMPLFLFSATFFPLERYPAALASIVQITPLYQGVALSRAAVLGDLHLGLLWHVLYLTAMGWIGVRIATRRIDRLLLP